MAELGLAATQLPDVRATQLPRPKTVATLDTAELSDSPAPLPPIDVRIPTPGSPIAEPSGDLVVRSLLAEGGMGRLFVAEQRSLAREVVVKTVRDRGDGAQARAIVAEATITGSLQHPNITPVHLAGVDTTGAPLLVMKRIVGVPWSALLAGDERAWESVAGLPRDRLRAHLVILSQVATAVHYAHERAIVHRDIKPDNVMLGALGEVYLVDWGVAIKQAPDDAPPRELVGTPCFAAPEMLGAGKLGPFTDVYLLGATLHFVLTGRYRHEGDSSADVLASAWRSEPHPYGAHVPSDLADLANAATSRSPSERPASALAFRRAIDDHLERATSLRLAADGWERVAELRAIAAGAEAPDPVRQARLVAEARFAFQSSLVSWPENPRAKEGTRASLEEALSIELTRENLAAARVIAAEIELPEALGARIDALEGLLRRRAQDAERLERLDHDTDVGLASRDRTRFLAGVTFVSILAGLVLLGSSPRHTVDPGDGGKLVLAAAAALVVALCGALVTRRTMLVNRMNRQLLVALVGAVAIVLVHRLVDWQSQADPVSTLRGDMLLFAMPCFAVAVFVRGRAWVAGAIPVAAALLSVWLRGLTLHLFVLATIGTVLTLALVLRGKKRPAGA